jgi:predicted alpha/beta superfamily hydrolase
MISECNISINNEGGISNMFNRFSRNMGLLFSIISFSILCTSQNGYAQKKSEEIIIGNKITIHSKILNENRKILIRLPEGYNRSKQKYPVLYLLDGEFFFLQATSAVQYLSELGYIRNQPISQMIVVGIVNVDRNRDYTPTYAPKQKGGLEFPTSGKAEIFLKFLNSELFPYIESNYRTEPYRILVGWSLGGLFTVYTFLEHPDNFSAYIAISPSLWWDGDLYVNKTKKLIGDNKIQKKKIAVTVGSLEGGDIGRSVRDGFIPLMTNKFGNKGFFKTIEIPNEVHNYGPYKALYEGLKLIYSDWQMPNDLLKGGLGAIKTFYEKLSKEYGYVIEVPEAAYSNIVNYVYNQVSTEAAVETAKLYVKAYPESSYAYYRLGLFSYLSGKLEAAKENLQKALNLENKTPNPDSERIVTYTINLHKVEKAMAGKNNGEK